MQHRCQRLEPDFSNKSDCTSSGVMSV